MPRLPRAERRQQILNAAIDLFAEGGFRGVTTKRIARAAGVSEGTIFLHFPTKHALYDAMLLEKMQGHHALAELVPADEAVPLAETLTRLADRLLDKQHRNRALLRLLLYSALEEHSLAKELYHVHLQGPFAGLTELLRQARARGEIRAVDPEAAARIFAAIVTHHILMREIFGQDEHDGGSLQHTIANYVDIYLRGILPPQRGR
jgi:AcrR family transcriptional regulator